MINKKNTTIFLISAVFVLLGILPDILGQTLTARNAFRIGGFMGRPGVSDLMILEQIKQGNLLIKNLFTSENQANLLLPISHLPFGLLGKFFNISSGNLIIMEKILYAILFIGTFLWFIKIFYKDIKKQLITLIFLLFGSGFGLLVHPAIQASSDLWISEMYPLAALWNQPASLLYFSLILVSIYLCLKIYQNNSLKSVFFPLLLLLTVFEKPQIVVLISFSLFIFILIKAKNTHEILLKFRVLWFYLIIPLLVLCVYVIKIYTSQNIWLWIGQSGFYSPPFMNYIAGCGILGIFAFIFIVKNDAERINNGHLLLFCWICAAIVLLYTPFPQQRLFDFGLFIPVSILASEPLLGFIMSCRTKLKKKIHFLIFFAILVFLLFGTHSYLFYLTFRTYFEDPHSSASIIFNNDRKAFSWIKNNTDKNSIFVTDALYGHIVPAFTGRAVYFAKRNGSFATINLNAKTEEVKHFFFYSSSSEQLDFLRKNHISYIFLGQKEADESDLKMWKQKSYLEIVYQNDGVAVLKVR